MLLDILFMCTLDKDAPQFKIKNEQKLFYHDTLNYLFIRAERFENKNIKSILWDIFIQISA